MPPSMMKTEPSRQVGAAVDENQQFQLLFCTYVEMYSAKYAALLPADHQTVTITRYSRKPDGNGGYLKNPVDQVKRAISAWPLRLGWNQSHFSRENSTSQVTDLALCGQRGTQMDMF